MIRLQFRSSLHAPVERVWKDIVSSAAINDEMRPLMSMSMPDSLLAAFQPGVPLSRSRLRLFGLMPVGVSWLTLNSLTPMTGFVEVSPVTGMHSWRHERHLAPTPDGCTLLDTLTFEPRYFSGVTQMLVTVLFRHRHRRLRRRYG